MKKLTYPLLALGLLVCLTCWTVLAQVTNAVPAVPGAVAPAMDPATLWKLGIGLITPFIITGIRTLVPKIPNWMLPTATPLVGVLLGYAVNWLGAKNMHWVDMAQAGALAVFIRESFDQVVTKQCGTIAADQAPTPTPVPPPPAESKGS